MFNKFQLKFMLNNKNQTFAGSFKPFSLNTLIEIIFYVWLLDNEIYNATH